MHMLITGGAGFIGSHLAEAYQGRARVRVLDNLRTGRRENLSGMDVDFREASILDRRALREAMQGVDLVFHLAAMVSVPESMAAPWECVELNVGGTLAVLEEAERAGVRRLCFSSSSAVYGDGPELPKHEGMRPEPLSPYGITKLDGEYYCEMFARAGRLSTVSLRYFNVFGPRQDPASAYAAAVPIFIHRALAREPLGVFGDGGQTRDFVYVKDVVGANEFLAEREDVTGTFNVGYGGTVRIQDLAERVREACETGATIENLPERPGDVRHSRASAEALRALGWKPDWSMEEALEQTVAWYRNAGA